MDYAKEKEQVAYFMRRLYHKNLTTTSGGNVSYRASDKHILITPSALDKGRLKSEQIGVVTINGENLTPELKLSIETQLHLSVYRNRPDIKAIVHAHPVMATSFTAMHRKINCKLTAEARYVIKEPVFATYGLMGTKELAQNVAEAALKGDVILMENHGVMGIADTLLLAFDRVEVLEATAKMTLITEILNDKKELNSQQIMAIDSM